MYAIRSYYVCLCGEMATDPQTLLFLVGIGVREFSMAAPYIPKVKQLVRKISNRSAQRLAREVLALGESRQVRLHLAKAVAKLEKATSRS